VLPAVVLALAVGLGACAPPGSRGPASGLVAVVGLVTAAPTCPVERAPPAPACSAQPVPNAVISIRDADGTEVMSVVSGADGAFVADLAPGTYRLVPQPVAGLLGTPSPVSVEVRAGESRVVVDVGYDTGIR